MKTQIHISEIRDGKDKKYTETMLDMHTARYWPYKKF